MVGFPRSGTTMLEQMLDAHPTLASMDEQPFLQGVTERVLALGLEYPEALGELEPCRVRRACGSIIGSRYARSSRCSLANAWSTRIR